MNFLIFLFFPFFSQLGRPGHAPLSKVDNFKLIILGQIGQYHEWMAQFVSTKQIHLYLRTKCPEKLIFAQEHKGHCILKSWESFLTHIALPFLNQSVHPQSLGIVMSKNH